MHDYVHRHALCFIIWLDDKTFIVSPQGSKGQLIHETSRLISMCHNYNYACILCHPAKIIL